MLRYSRSKTWYKFTLVLVANNRYQSFQWFWSARCAGEVLLPDLAFDFLLIEGRLLCFTPRQHARSLCRHPCVPFPSVSTLMAPKAKSVEEGYYYFSLCCEAIVTSHEFGRTNHNCTLSHCECLGVWRDIIDA